MGTSAFLIKSATDGVGAITDLVDVQERELADDVVNHHTDSDQYVQGVYIGAVYAEITVTTTDANERQGRSIGDTGTLTIVRQQRANGTGAVSMADKTATYGAVVLVSIDDGAPSEGEGTTVFTYRAYDDGTDIVTHS